MSFFIFFILFLFSPSYSSRYSQIVSSSVTPLYFPGSKCSGGVPHDICAHSDHYIFRQIILEVFFTCDKQNNSVPSAHHCVNAAWNCYVNSLCDWLFCKTRYVTSWRESLSRQAPTSRSVISSWAQGSLTSAPRHSCCLCSAPQLATASF